MTERRIPIEKLAAFALGELGSDESARVQSQLDRSPEDRAFVESVLQLVATMQADDSHEPTAAVLQRAVSLMRDQHRTSPTESILQSAQHAIEVIAHLVIDTFAQPTLAGFRGASEARHLMFQSDAAEIDVQITPHEGGPAGSRIVRGQVASLSEISAEAVLWRAEGAGTPAVRTPLDANGNFKLECNLGSYELAAVLAGTIVRVPTITIT